MYHFIVDSLYSKTAKDVCEFILVSFILWYEIVTVCSIQVQHPCNTTTTPFLHAALYSLWCELLQQKSNQNCRSWRNGNMWLLLWYFHKEIHVNQKAAPSFEWVSWYSLKAVRDASDTHSQISHHSYEDHFQFYPLLWNCNGVLLTDPLLLQHCRSSSSADWCILQDVWVCSSMRSQSEVQSLAEW